MLNNTMTFKLRSDSRHLMSKKHLRQQETTSQKVCCHSSNNTLFYHKLELTDEHFQLNKSKVFQRVNNYNSAPASNIYRRNPKPTAGALDGVWICLDPFSQAENEHQSLKLSPGPSLTRSATCSSPNRMSA